MISRMSLSLSTSIFLFVAEDALITTSGRNAPLVAAAVCVACVAILKCRRCFLFSFSLSSDRRRRKALQQSSTINDSKWFELNAQLHVQELVLHHECHAKNHVQTNNLPGGHRSNVW